MCFSTNLCKEDKCDFSNANLCKQVAEKWTGALLPYDPPPLDSKMRSLGLLEAKIIPKWRTMLPPAKQCSHIKMPLFYSGRYMIIANANFCKQDWWSFIAQSYISSFFSVMIIIVLVFFVVVFVMASIQNIGNTVLNKKSPHPTNWQICAKKKTLFPLPPQTKF